MSRQKSFGKLLALALGVAVLAPALSADAGKPKQGPRTEPAALQNKLSLSPRGLSWGMTPKEVARLYDRVIDKDYLKEFKTVQPGIQMTRLQAEISEKKAEFRRSRLDFGDLPSRLDGTSFVGEFSYLNQEAAMDIKRKGRHRYFFFIRERLWKIIDVYPLAENAKYGKDYKSGVAKLEKLLGVKGRVQKSDPDKGPRLDEADWADAKTHLRAVNWGEKEFAIAWEDKATVSRLPSLRTAKPKKGGQIDPAVADVIRTPKTEPGPPPPKKKKK